MRGTREMPGPQIPQGHEPTAEVRKVQDPMQKKSNKSSGRQLDLRSWKQDTMATDDDLPRVILTPDPAMYRPKPSSEQTQDISHLLTSLFKNIYTGEVIGREMGAKLIRSKGGDNPYHQKFVEELQQIRTEYDRRMVECDNVERHIIQARARATAEEERMLNCLKDEVGDLYQNLGLPPVESHFRWCVDNDLLKKHKLICPEEYITDTQPVTRAPRGLAEPSCYKETFSFHRRVSRSPVDDGYRNPSLPDMSPKSLVQNSSSSLTLSSLSSSENISLRKMRKKSRSSKKRLQKMEMSAEEREAARSGITQLEKRHNFLRNPRFLPPSSQQGGRSLIVPAKTREMLSGKSGVVEDPDADEPIPVFLANPPVIFFPEYEVGQTYEMTVELKNMTASSRHFRVIPPSSPYFSLGLGKFPGEGGIVAPGMSCHHTVRFVPDSLADFEDFLLVETQAPYPVLVPIEARRPPPVLTVPRTLDCGPCLVDGVKFIELLCRNEGLSRGRFCIMPKSVWPPANFRTVANAGFVEQLPFCIRPAVFELYPGQETILEVVFFPLSAEPYSQVFTIVCDNCQVKDVTLTGYGEVLGLQLISPREEGSVPADVTDVSNAHLVKFQSTNLHCTEQKDVVIRNTTHVELPFYWQIVQPHLQSSEPEEISDMTTVTYNIDDYTAFAVSPLQGILQPHKDHIFTVTYTPTELIEYHSIAQMILQDVPGPPSAEQQPSSLTELQPTIQDVIVIDLEVTGTTEAFHLLLEPYAVIFSGESFIGSPMRKRFKMWNNSKSSIHYKWENISSANIIQIEPNAGNIESRKFSDFELIFTGVKPGFTSKNVICHIRHSPEPVVLHVEATFKGPAVSILIPSLDLGLIRLGNQTLSTFTIENTGPLEAKWKFQESKSCLAARGEAESRFSMSPDSGMLPPLSMADVSVVFKPLTCQRLETVLELEVGNGEGSYLPVTVDVQVPQVCLLSSSLMFSEVYVGVPAQSTVKMYNQGQLPTKFSWQEFTGSHPAVGSVSVTPRNGVLGPNEGLEMCVTLETSTLDEVKDLTLRCLVEDMKDPLVLNIKAKAKGLHVSYSSSAAQESSNDLLPSNDQDLLLDFGSEVTLQSTAKRTLTITNHSGISAPFSLRVFYFSGCLTLQTPRSSVSLIQRTARFAKEVTRRADADFRASVLSDGKGAAFLPHPSTGTLGPFQQISVDVTAYNDMWGEYSDVILCTVGDLSPKEIPVKMTVKGCPLYFQVTGPRPGWQTEGPVIRFGTHVSGGDTISRCLRINNPGPCDIRIDWETYNREQDSSRLLDLLMLFGDPFPLKDLDGNEVVDSSLDLPESEDSSVDWDKIPSTSGATSSSSSRSISKLEEGEQTEHVYEGDDLNGPGSEIIRDDKLISVILRSHEGVASDYPYCITPRQTIVPSRGHSTIHVSFTPLILSDITRKMECSGYALGFLSLDDMSTRQIPGKVKRLHGYGVEPIRMELQAFVKPALLTVEFDDEDEEGLVFYSVASCLIPDKTSSSILPEFTTNRKLKLLNCTETPLYFSLLLSKPFAVAAVDPNKSIQTSQSDREERAAQMVLQPQQHALVEVSFCTTLELLTYQNLPDDQMLPGVKILQTENGERKLHFTQRLVIEYSNNSSQQIPVCAYLAVPVLQLSCDAVDFGTCFVGQTRTQEVFLMNCSGSKSYWTALLDKRERQSGQDIFSISPTGGTLDAHVSHTSCSKEMLLVTFTARTNKAYETVVMVHGMLGEKPLRLQIKGRGSYDEKYETFVCS